MTNTEIYYTLELKAFNQSYFARKLYPNRKKAPDYFYRRLKFKNFSIGELNKLNLILKEFANSEI